MYFWLLLGWLLLLKIVESKDDLPYPDVFVIGTMKGGTTSIHDLFIDHANLCTSNDDGEPHYFDRKGMSRQHYIDAFKYCKSSQLSIDKTPSYIRVNGVAKSIKNSYTKENLHKKKFILSLREPIARMYSEYGMAGRFRTLLFPKRSLIRLNNNNNNEEEILKKYKQIRKNASKNDGKFNEQSNGKKSHSSIQYTMCSNVVWNIRKAHYFEDLKFKSFNVFIDNKNDHVSIGKYTDQLISWT